ncbi:MAG: DUF751 family protein [Pseudanabaenaceae cyanobacterium bins.68]|nr:DUF751 family protein [Pseudanabaenaceae cyanobacterium bins.68]
MKDFLDNLIRFPKFLALISLGVLSSFFAPVVPLLKRPATAIALVVALVGGFMALSFTLRAMLGYDPV